MSWPQYTELGKVWTFYGKDQRVVELEINERPTPLTLTADSARAAAAVLVSAADEIDDWERKCAVKALADVIAEYRKANGVVYEPGLERLAGYLIHAGWVKQ